MENCGDFHFSSLILTIISPIYFNLEEQIILMMIYVGLSLLDLKMFHRACFYVKLGGRILFCSLMTGKYGRSWTNYK